MVGFENERSLFSDGVAVFENGKSKILFMKDQKVELEETFNKVGGEYVGVTTSFNLDSSTIVTLGSDEGYVRVIELSVL